jgi:hypothetical protein
MSRMLEALRQIESKRAAIPEQSQPAPSTPPAALPPIILRPNPLGDDPRLRFSGSSPFVLPAPPSTFLTPALEPLPAPPPTPKVIAPIISSPPKIATLPSPPLILPLREFKSEAHLVGQFDNRWSVTNSAIAPTTLNHLLGQSSTVHSLTSAFAETRRPETPLLVVPPSEAMAAKYGDLVDQLLSELRQGANHVLGLPALSHVAYLAGVATNIGIVLTQKRLGPVLLVETPGDAVVLTGKSPSRIGRFGEQGLLEAMQGQPWGDLIHRTSLEGLSILRAGIQPLDMEPASIAASIESLWTELRADFRFILVSVPPYQDSVSDILLCTTDRIYVVLEVGASLLAQTQAILRRWEDAGGHAVGCIALES